MAQDYKAILADALAKYADLVCKRDDILVELQKLDEFIQATMNMLPDKDRDEFSVVFNEAAKRIIIQTTGLTDAIRKVLREAPQGRYLTAAQVRDRLQASGFDFREYRSNPLASVSTTLRRLPPEEAETADINGVAGYRINQTLARTLAKAEAVRQSKIRSGRLGGVLTLAKLIDAQKEGKEK
jgi:hypothetical protein